MIIDDPIGDEGATRISEALVKNTALTKLYSGSDGREKAVSSITTITKKPNE